MTAIDPRPPLEAEAPAPGRSAGHLIVAQLEREGVRRVYGVPGESYLDVLDGLHDSVIETVVTRQEGGAGFMALAEGRLTGVPGVALVTRGPGAANAFIAVHTAWQDATPLVLFIGLIPVADRGREAFQEFDLTGWFGSTAKHVVSVDDPASAARVVSEAFRIARSGRPGPVVVGLPEDVLRLSAGGEGTVGPAATAQGGPSRADLAELAARLHAADRPVLVVGGEGWTDDAGAALHGWALTHRIPVLADFRAYDAIPHALADGRSAYAGALGYGRADAAAALLDDADLAVFVGTARTDVLSDGYTLGQQAETVLVLPSEPKGHGGRVDQVIVSDPVAFVRGLETLDPAGGRDVHGADRLASAVDAHRAFSRPVLREDAEDGYADLTGIMAVLREELTRDAVITYGAGNHALWAARYLPHHRTATLVAPRNGAMGMGIPAAVAAALAFPRREVVSVAGDGCFLMNGQEIATAVGYGAAFVAVVVDNGVYATIREHQEAHYPGRPSGTHLTNPDFAAYGRSFGAFGETITRTSQFRDAYRRARASGLPAVLHVRQDPGVRSPSSAA
ncbi:thiamine pyrophosphate-binding protein [Microbacterium betulae]|uniref:Thiamine pyrophosphate-binding protein n=1 Tax=Microbacterium betulae TaxID=2981139 RepID=A0AA97FG78_9MICO|nr:thiamine pyrophosphate-dependent enzyme [Microbacterium sp. AB]WOF22901.1 thiamine pyrophosphate-binding protein [Microbacterium sp. AB]